MLNPTNPSHHKEDSPTRQDIEEEMKPKRRSFLQVWLPRFKFNPATTETQKVEIEPTSPLTPVELPRIEQLQPIGTDISSEIQFQQQQQSIQVDTTMSDDQETNKEDQPIEDQEQDDTRNEDQIVKQVTIKDHPPADENDQDAVAAAADDDDDDDDDDQPNKKESPKRTSLILKLLFPKRAASSPSTPPDTKLPMNDHLLTEQQQDGSDLTSQPLLSTDAIQDMPLDAKEERIESIQVTSRPSSPLGRHVSALLSRMPTLKDKSLGRKPKLESEGKLLLSDETPNTPVGYENEKLTGTNEPSATIAA